MLHSELINSSSFFSYPPNVKSCVKKEIARLEEKALNADTEDEWLACELQAVELQISLVSLYFIVYMVNFAGWEV